MAEVLSPALAEIKHRYILRLAELYRETATPEALVEYQELKAGIDLLQHIGKTNVHYALVAFLNAKLRNPR